MSLQFTTSKCFPLTQRARWIIPPEHWEIFSVITANSANVAQNTSSPLLSTGSITEHQKYYGKNTFA